MDLQEDISYINADRVPTRNLYHIAVRPLSANARYFVLRYGHEADARRGVATVIAGSGCELALLDEADDGTIFAVLRFNRTDLDELGRCRFSYTIDLHSTEPTKPAYVIASASLMVQVIKRIQFEPPTVPKRIWWFRGVDPFQDRLEPAQEQILTPSPNHLYVHEFYDLEGEACGVAWQWATN